MWQRIQTVWLLVASVLMAIFPWQDLLYFTEVGQDVFYTLTAWAVKPSVAATGEFAMGISALGVLSLLSSLISVVTIFLFKKRVLQMRLCVFNTILLFSMLAFVLFLTFFYMESLGVEFVGAKFYLAFPCVSLVLQLLARRGILKDETLIRMSNRLR